MSEHCYSSYLEAALSHKTSGNIIRNLAEAIKVSGLKFDSVAFCGMSGALVAPRLCSRIRKKMVMVRKPHDNRHSSYDVEGYRDLPKYIIVDDLTSSGCTIRHIIDEMKRFSSAECQGIFLYVQSENIINFDYNKSKFIPQVSIYAGDEKLSDQFIEKIRAFFKPNG